MSYYQTLRIDQAIQSEQDRLQDYRATGHFQADATPDFRLEVQPAHALSQGEVFDLSLDELQRVRWALSLSPEQYAARQAPPSNTAAVLEDLALSLDASAEVERSEAIAQRDSYNTGAAEAYERAAAALRRKAAVL